MQQATYHANTQWTHRIAIERRTSLPRGMLLSQARDAGTLVNRVLTMSRLDGKTLNYLAGMLTITVQDWMHHRA